MSEFVFCLDFVANNFVCVCGVFEMGFAFLLVGFLCCVCLSFI